MDIVQIEEKARKIRKDILEMTYHAGANGGHLGGALSSADILAALYGSVMMISPQMLHNREHDRFILSKGHISLAHYAVLYEFGFLNEEEILSFEKDGSLFSTHEVIKPESGIEFSGGSLGYGVSVAVGIALAAKIRNSSFYVYTLLGDGECNEGIVWEAVMAAVRFKLDNLTIIVDVNKQQLDGFTENIMPISDIGAVFQSFGCAVKETDGHNVEELVRTLGSRTSGVPYVLLANTIKGKGIASIEGKTGWYHARLTRDQFDQFTRELDE